MKDRLLLTAKQRASKLYMKVKNEMKRLSNKLDRIKEKKSNRDRINYVTSLYEENINEDHHQENINEDHHQENINVDHHQNEKGRITSQNYNNITNRKHYRRGRKCKNKSKRNQKKKTRRHRKLARKREEWENILEKSKEVHLPDNMYEPLNNTNYQLSEIEKKVTSLGLKFVPTVKRHNTLKKYTDFLGFCRKLRLAFFYHTCKESTTEESEKIITTTIEEIEESDDGLWKKKSQFKPAPGKSEALVEFISELESYLFNPHNARKVKYNLTKEENTYLKNLSKWSKDEECPHMLRIQDKGSELVIESKETYSTKC